MSAVTRLATLVRPPQVSPERERLGVAIAAARTRRDEITAAKTAVSRADDAWHDARAARVRAEEAVEAAKTATAEHMAAEALGTAGAPPVTIRAARAALLDAEDTETAAKAALDAVKQRLDDLQQFSDLIQDRVTEAVRSVLASAPEVDRLLAETEELQNRLIENHAALRHLDRRKGLERGNPYRPGNVPTRADRVMDRLVTPPSSWGEPASGPSVTLMSAMPGYRPAAEPAEPPDPAARWVAWATALKSDASAMLDPPRK